MVIKTVTNADTGTADIVGGDDWDALATIVNETVLPASYIVYKSGSTTKAFNATTKTLVTSGSDSYTVITALFAALPSSAGKLIHLLGDFSLSNSIKPPSYVRLMGEVRYAENTKIGTRLIPSGDFPAVIIDVGTIRTTLEYLDFEHNQSGYTSALLQIRESANTNNYNNLFFFDNHFKVGNAIKLSNQAGTAIGIIKQNFHAVETYGFLDAVKAEVTTTASAFVNGATFSDCAFWYPKNAAFKTDNINNTRVDQCNFINCQVQAQPTGGNQTVCAFDYDDSGQHYYTTHTGVMAWDLGTGSFYAKVNSGTQLILVGCTPSYRIGGSGATGHRTRDLGYHGNAKGRSVFSGDGTTTDFTITHNGGGILAGDCVPNIGLVYPGSSDARGNPYVDDATISATTMVVKFPVAPPSGTNNIILYWEVGIVA